MLKLIFENLGEESCHFNIDYLGLKKYSKLTGFVHIFPTRVLYEWTYQNWECSDENFFIFMTNGPRIFNRSIFVTFTKLVV